MFKRIILASALAIVSSFASWDLFPVLEYHKGQTRLTSIYTTYSDEGREYHALNLTLGSRYTVFPDLELALVVPYHVFSYYNGNRIGTDGTGKIWLLTRYQFIPSMNVFADIGFPNEYECCGEDPWNFDVGLQFSRKVNRLFNFGSQLEFATQTKGEGDDIPLSMYAALELDFTITEDFSPYIRTAGLLELGEYSDHGYQFSHGGGDLSLSSYVGVKYDFDETFSVDAATSVGRWVNVKDCPLGISVHLNLLMNF